MLCEVVPSCKRCIVENAEKESKVCKLQDCENTVSEAYCMVSRRN